MAIPAIFLIWWKGVIKGSEKMYGKLANGELMVNRQPINGYKPIVYQDYTYDPETQYVVEGRVEDREDFIFVETIVKEVETTDEGEGEEI